jgi:uncharacterized protein YvpB
MRLEQITTRLPLSQVAQNFALSSQVQQRLIGLRLLDPPVDGIFGPKTTAAFRRFQTLVGITAEPDSLGPQTARQLLTVQPQNLATNNPVLSIIVKTKLKLRPLQSTELRSSEILDAEPGQSFALVDYEAGHRRHYKVTFSQPVRSQRVWYAYDEHVKIIDGKQQIINSGPPRQVRLNVPFKSQLDNWYNPTGSCNVTSIAMCLEYLGVRRYDLRYRQLEDELYRYMLDSGLSRHSPQDLAKVVRDYGRRDDFTVWGTIDRAKDHIAKGNPVVVHGYFTSFGHIIVLVGYDQNGFIVHDPYGEWFSTGYRTDLSGAFLHYSYNLIRNTCMADGQFWTHFISR